MDILRARRAPSAGACSAAVAAALLLVGSAPVADEPGVPNGTARQFLSAELGLTPAELVRLDQGAVVTQFAETSDRREVAVKGVVRIGIAPQTYIDQLTDIATFKRHEAVLEIGVFGSVPTAADMADLSLERGDLRDLRSCRVGDCDWKLPAATIRRLQQQVPGSTADADRRVHELIREELAAYVARYSREGDRALMQYDSGRSPVDVAQEFRGLLDTDPGLLDRFPTLLRYVRAYPHGRRDGIRDVIYWSREKPGPSPVLSITHMIFAPGEPGSPVSYVVMSRQIYGSKYFDASMGLTLVLPDRARDGPASFVAYVNRSRLDVFGGIFGGLVRRTVRSRVRSGMAESLARVKVAMERQSSPDPVQWGPKYDPPVSARSLLK
jgi:hypothetical protein